MHYLLQDLGEGSKFWGDTVNHRPLHLSTSAFPTEALSQRDMKEGDAGQPREGRRRDVLGTSVGGYLG